MKSHDKFRTKYELDFSLASDESKSHARKLRRMGREEHVRAQVHGRRADNNADRSGRENRAGLAESQVPGHAQEVLEAAQAL